MSVPVFLLKCDAWASHPERWIATSWGDWIKVVKKRVVPTALHAAWALAPGFEPGASDPSDFQSQRDGTY
jgi:hypothetical protein